MRSTGVPAREAGWKQVPALARFVGARMLPLAVFLVLVVGSSAPLASLVLGRRALDERARATAGEVAGWIRGEVQQRPGLWRYDTAKVVGHLRAYAVGEDVDTIVVVDDRGTPLELGGEIERARLLAAPLRWAAADVFVGAERVGAVWVAVSEQRIRRDALLLLLLFGTLGVALAALMFGIPLRAAGAAELRIRDLVARLERSRSELEALNRDLEARVEARSGELRRTYERLRGQERHLRELSGHALALQEQERRSIARDLHDSVGQALTAIRLHLQLIGERSTDGELARIADRSLRLVDEALEEIRRTVQNLGPAILDDVGLVEALRRYCDDFAERTGIPVHHRVDEPAEPVPGGIESACYRILQEALTNVARHAAPSAVEVRFEAPAERIRLSVRDDGRGFDPRRGESEGHGLAGIRERVELLGGTLSIESGPDAGCTLRVELPRPTGRVPGPARDAGAYDDGT